MTHPVALSGIFVPTFPARRDVLRTLIAAAGLPAINAASTPMRRVGIIGGGMAGVCLAWLLDGSRDVVLLESGPAIGGNVQTITVDLDGQSFPVDMGAQFFHPGPYPLYTRLLSFLGLYPAASPSFPASITVYADPEPVPRFLSPVLPNRIWPVFAPWNRAGLEAFSVAFAAAKIREQQQGDWSVTMDQWLLTLGLTAAQRNGMLLPWTASIFSGSIEQARSLSARAAMIFAAKALPDSLLDPLAYYVLNDGMTEPLHRMLQQTSTVQVLTGSRVTSVLRHPAGFELRRENGDSVLVDDLVLATPAEASRKLLQAVPGTLAQQFALNGIQFHDARLLLHTHAEYATADPNFWSFLNCRATGEWCEASMWMADVLSVPARPTAAKLWKSWVTHREREPKQILHEVRFRHMLPTPATLAAQAVLASLQGAGGIWFAGGCTLPYDSQETAVLSALRAAWGLHVTSTRDRMLQGF
jgi:uncharacterized protein